MAKPCQAHRPQRRTHVPRRRPPHRAPRQERTLPPRRMTQTPLGCHRRQVARAARQSQHPNRIARLQRASPPPAATPAHSRAGAVSERSTATRSTAFPLRSDRGHRSEPPCSRRSHRAPRSLRVNTFQCASAARTLRTPRTPRHSRPHPRKLRSGTRCSTRTTALPSPRTARLRHIGRPLHTRPLRAPHERHIRRLRKADRNMASRGTRNQSKPRTRRTLQRRRPLLHRQAASRQIHRPRALGRNQQQPRRVRLRA